jgi:integrase
MTSLPPHVYAVRDRHGKLRYRYVRKGWKSHYLPGEPGEGPFHSAYAQIVAQGPVSAVPIKGARKPTPHSLDDLFSRMKNSVRWSKKKATTQQVQANAIEQFLNRTGKRTGKRYGERPAASVTVAWLDEKFGEMADRPAAANNLRKFLAVMMDHAVKLGWRADNPVRFTDTFQESKDGFHTWTDAEIEQYRAHYPLGTMARLTLELALNTAARRCNIATLTRDDIASGRITTAHAKGSDETTVPLTATTRAALEALPAAPIKHLIVTTRGKPFSVAGLGNKMREWCDDAGLSHCSMHGLRKAISRQLAEAGATDAQGQAVTGHKKATTFQHYRAKANRAALADDAFSNLGTLSVSNHDGKD